MRIALDARVPAGDGLIDGIGVLDERHVIDAQQLVPTVTHFDAAAVDVEGHGNVLVATAFLHGLAVEDVGERRLQPADAGYEIVITARARA